MKKQLTIAVGVLLTLGTAVSATLNDYSEPAKSVTDAQPAALEMDSKQSAQIVAVWNTHASSSGSVPLARPL
jgi:hypothetical protein